ncbi:6-O-methylguanine DNA methyltransferase [bacterium F11]|nr:6-O-methylguanine DNA methyltransferase [bacterium F11]
MATYSPFSQKVWRTCAQIPKGETRTYQWIARKIGKPEAARAVGYALKMNPFAPAVPCHRIIRSDGSMGGYSGSGGIQEKLRLLRREGAI